jgi:hypothetical protein
MTLANLRHFLICAHFRFNALLPAASCCDEPLFLMGISFVIYAHFFQGCNCGIKEELGVMPFSYPFAT